MRLFNVIEKLEAFAPLSLAEAWDNVGLMVGDENAEIKKAVVTLDVTEEVIDFAIENHCEMIVSHHPFIMSLSKTMAYSGFLNKRIYKLIKHDIAVYSMHTNFDSCVGGVNQVLCEKLGLVSYLTEEPDIIWAGKLQSQMTLKAFIDRVKHIFHTDVVMYSGDLHTQIHTVAVCGGSGGSFIEMAKKEKHADVYFTGEVKYHDFQLGESLGLPIVTAGHFETENISLFKIRELLTTLDVDVLETDAHTGFSRVLL